MRSDIAPATSADAAPGTRRRIRAHSSLIPAGAIAGEVDRIDQSVSPTMSRAPGGFATGVRWAVITRSCRVPACSVSPDSRTGVSAVLHSQACVTRVDSESSGVAYWLSASARRA